jgi:hypothetical protein
MILSVFAQTVPEPAGDSSGDVFLWSMGFLSQVTWLPTCPSSWPNLSKNPVAILFSLSHPCIDVTTALQSENLFPLTALIFVRHFPHKLLVLYPCFGVSHSESRNVT